MAVRARPPSPPKISIKGNIIDNNIRNFGQSS